MKGSVQLYCDPPQLALGDRVSVVTHRGEELGRIVELYGDRLKVKLRRGVVDRHITQASYMPTAGEIAKACERFRARWPRVRAGETPQEWTPPECYTADVVPFEGDAA